MQVNILFDKGRNAHLFQQKCMAAELNIIPTTTEGLTLASFGTDSPTNQQVAVTSTVKVEANSGELVPISILTYHL